MKLLIMRCTFFLLLSCCMIIRTASASTILEVDFDELCRSSELVVDARVIDRTSRVDQETGMIWSTVTLEVREVVVGDNQQATITLEYLGGTYQGATMHVDESSLPDVGESGIYFVQNRTARLVHPLTGWKQGHFLLSTDSSGVERVSNSDRMPVIGIAASQVRAPRAISNGIARGVLIGEPSENRSSGAMSKSEFKALIRDTITEPNR